MQITGFTPTTGAAGTPVRLSLTEVPEDASTDNTHVQLNGRPTVGINSVGVEPGGNGTIDVTVEENSETGVFVVVIHGDGGFITATSTTEFRVTAPPGMPEFTNLIPRTTEAGKDLMLTGTSLHEIQTVTIGTTIISNIRHSGEELIRLTVPPSLQPGEYRLYGTSPRFGYVRCPFVLNVVASVPAAEEAAR